MRSTLRLYFVLGGALIAALAVAGARTYAQNSERPPVHDLPNPYHEVKDWFQMPPARTLGAMSAIDIDRDGKSLWMAERCGGLRAAGRGPA